MFTRGGVARATDANRATDRRNGGDSWHIHWFRWSRDDPFSGSSLYACRCGVVRPGL